MQDQFWKAFEDEINKLAATKIRGVGKGIHRRVSEFGGSRYPTAVRMSEETDPFELADMVDILKQKRRGYLIHSVGQQMGAIKGAKTETMASKKKK